MHFDTFSESMQNLISHIFLYGEVSKDLMCDLYLFIYCLVDDKQNAYRPEFSCVQIMYCICWGTTHNIVALFYGKEQLTFSWENAQVFKALAPILRASIWNSPGAFQSSQRSQWLLKLGWVCLNCSTFCLFLYGPDHLDLRCTFFISSQWFPHSLDLFIGSKLSGCLFVNQVPNSVSKSFSCYCFEKFLLKHYIISQIFKIFCSFLFSDE